MSFKKLHPVLKEALDTGGLVRPTALQKKALPILKGGADAYVIGEKDSGKTTALIIHTVHKLKAEAFEDSPRALIIVEDKEKALLLKSRFEQFTRQTDLRIYTVYDAYDIEKQKTEIYYGQDIVIATPARLSKLYFLNGIHLGQIQLFAIDNANHLARHNAYNHILRLTESLHKCQYVIMADVWNKRIANYQSSFMSNAQVIKSN